jgi:DNA-binding Lrp family transcriptional regulator
MRKAARVDRIDAKLLLILIEEPRATVSAIAERVGLSRNTVQARLAKLDEDAIIGSPESSIDPTVLGYPLTAFINVRVRQRLLSEVADFLRGIPEVIEVTGLSGVSDLLVRVAARDADDLYRIAGHILAAPGVEHTETALAMRKLVNHRLVPLLNRIANDL